ncbi:DedA family protein [Ancylobacter sp. 6x-1]|uniref:DedA family protein n=1 Tax=Ancylobacter crimeensis TaxID=2579147 RepID=A0ABT0DAP8_9HYPH|nr:DedA family protein [Ancylobacter crimeensis]MCK0197040.1 DedA family protein [Ancylobacter crimeensis]
MAREALGFVEAHRHYAPFIAFLLAFGESLAVISLLVPATVILVGMGPLIAAGGLGFLPVWAGATLGAALGDTVSYWVGRYFKDRVRSFPILRNHLDMLDKGERFFRRHGVWSVFLGRFFGPLRAVVPLVAGMFEMPRLPFQLANVGSAALWAFVLLAPGSAAMKLFGW